MNPEDVGRILDEIGERIGPAGEFAWQITVRQVVIDAMLWGALGFFALLVAVTVFVACRRSDAAAIAEGPNPNDLFGWSGAVAFTGLALIPALALLIWPATMLLNPEYHAMLRLLEGIVPR